MRELEDKSRVCKFVRLEREVGMEPVMVLLRKERNLRRWRRERSWGRGPVKRLEVRSREARKERRPRWGGMVPERLVWERFSADTLWWRGLQVTPIQLQTGLEVVQFVARMREGSEVIRVLKMRRVV